MADKTKMTAKHEFTMAQSIFIQINWNLKFEENVEKRRRVFFLKIKMADSIKMA
jgi:hypothetical protein